MDDTNSMPARLQDLVADVVVSMPPEALRAASLSDADDEGASAAGSSLLVCVLLAHLLQAGFRPLAQLPAAAIPAEAEEKSARNATPADALRRQRQGSKPDDAELETNEARERARAGSRPRRAGSLVRRTRMLTRDTTEARHLGLLAFERRLLELRRGRPRSPGRLATRSITKPTNRCAARRPRWRPYPEKPVRRSGRRPSGHHANDDNGTRGRGSVSKGRPQLQLQLQQLRERRAAEEQEIKRLLKGMLPAGWPAVGLELQLAGWSLSLWLPPFQDSELRLVLLPARYRDVLLVNLTLSEATFTVAVPVSQYVDYSRGSPVLKDMPELYAQLTEHLVRPVSCFLRTANGVLNPSLLGMPVGVVLRILALLRPSEVNNVGRTCRALNSLARDPGLWRYLVARDFGPPVRTRQEPDWRAEYRRLQKSALHLQIRRPTSDHGYHHRLSWTSSPLFRSYHRSLQKVPDASVHAGSLHRLHCVQPPGGMPGPGMPGMAGTLSCASSSAACSLQDIQEDAPDGLLLKMNQNQPNLSLEDFYDARTQASHMHAAATLSLQQISRPSVRQCPETQSSRRSSPRVDADEEPTSQLESVPKCSRRPSRGGAVKTKTQIDSQRGPNVGSQQKPLPRAEQDDLTHTALEQQGSREHETEELLSAASSSLSEVVNPLCKAHSSLELVPGGRRKTRSKVEQQGRRAGSSQPARIEQATSNNFLQLPSPEINGILRKSFDNMEQPSSQNLERRPSLRREASKIQRDHSSVSFVPLQTSRQNSTLSSQRVSQQSSPFLSRRSSGVTQNQSLLINQKHYLISSQSSLSQKGLNEKPSESSQIPSTKPIHLRPPAKAQNKELPKGSQRLVPQSYLSSPDCEKLVITQRIQHSSSKSNHNQFLTPRGAPGSFSRQSSQISAQESQSKSFQISPRPTSHTFMFELSRGKEPQPQSESSEEQTLSITTPLSSSAKSIYGETSSESNPQFSPAVSLRPAQNVQKGGSQQSSQGEVTAPPARRSVGRPPGQPAAPPAPPRVLDADTNPSSPRPTLSTAWSFSNIEGCSDGGSHVDVEPTAGTTPALRSSPDEHPQFYDTSGDLALPQTYPSYPSTEDDDDDEEPRPPVWRGFTSATLRGGGAAEGTFETLGDHRVYGSGNVPERGTAPAPLGSLLETWSLAGNLGPGAVAGTEAEVDVEVLRSVPAADRILLRRGHHLRQPRDRGSRHEMINTRSTNAGT